MRMETQTASKKQQPQKNNRKQPMATIIGLQHSEKSRIRRKASAGLLKKRYISSVKKDATLSTKH